MLVVETVGRIRREHFVQRKSIKEIARGLRISRNTVRKILRSGETDRVPWSGVGAVLLGGLGRQVRLRWPAG
jgi:hypothetical protein